MTVIPNPPRWKRIQLGGQKVSLSDAAKNSPQVIFRPCGTIFSWQFVAVLCCLLFCGCEPKEHARPEDFTPVENSPRSSSSRKTPRPSQPEFFASSPASDQTGQEKHRSEAKQPEQASPPAPKPAPVRVRRPADRRPQYDDAALAQLGIAKYSSRRLILYSDIDPRIARTLPPLMDQAYQAWVEYFGPLPEAEDGSDFQLTGFLMKDRRLFLETGLLPKDLIDFQHGRHRGYQFWMHEQKYDYYRRHLLIHEGTHCFMMITPAPVRPPLWYLEGMAELFGTHQIQPDGSVRFRVMPDRTEDVVGFGRIEMIQQAIHEQRGLTLDRVLELSAHDFTVSRSDPYAWSWALCQWLDAHPRYRDRFRKLASVLDGAEFRQTFQRLFTPDFPILHAEWNIFSHTLAYGYNFELAAIEFAPGVELPPGASVQWTLPAQSGWQCSRIAVSQGRKYRILCNGTVTLARQPRPWVSEPQGISIRYAGGQPIGRVIAAIQSRTPADKEGNGSLLKVIDIGRLATFSAPVDGVLYLRVNDFWGELEDNTGQYEITIEALN